jgi:hypothetical protein
MPAPRPEPAPQPRAAATPPAERPQPAVVAPLPSIPSDTTSDTTSGTASDPAADPRTGSDPSSPGLLDEAAAFTAAHWPWLSAVLLLPLMLWGGAWIAHRRSYDAAGLPRGPRL